MKLYKYCTLAGVALIGLTPGLAKADAMTSGGFTSHHLVEEEPYEPYAEALPGDEKQELREYLDYETREPCQFYQPIPQGFVREGCQLVRVEPRKVAVKKQVAVNNVIEDYEIHFAFDSAAIEPAAGNVIDQIASEIRQYNPREVTVEGHTDKAGSSDYNIALSERRAEAVSEALSDRGVENRVLDKKAMGENDPAVNTQDGVKLRENRRVVVEFRK